MIRPVKAARKAAMGTLLLGVSLTLPINAAERTRMLCIGNSFSADAVETYLCPILNAGGFDFEVTNLYKPAAALENAWQSFENDTPIYQPRLMKGNSRIKLSETSVRAALNDGEWDIVTVQQASVLSGNYDTYSPAQQLIPAIRQAQPDAEIWYHQTWSYASTYTDKQFAIYNFSSEEMYDAICEAGQQFMADFEFAGILPAGTAIMNTRLNTGDRKGLTIDGAHLTPFGKFVVACTWYESLTGHDVRENGYQPKEFSAESTILAKEMAHFACLSPFSCTETRINPRDIRPRYNLLADSGTIKFFPVSAASHHIEIFTLSGECIFETDTTEGVEIKVDKGLYIVVIDRDNAIKLII